LALATGLLGVVDFRDAYAEMRSPTTEDDFVTPPPEGRSSLRVGGGSAVTVRFATPLHPSTFGPGLEVASIV
jgi:hypothetical protein